MNAEGTVTFEMRVTIVRGIRPDEDDRPEDYTGREAQRQIEKELLRVLRQIDGDCDVECMLKPTLAMEPVEERTIADGGHDTWAEFRGER